MFNIVQTDAGRKTVIKSFPTEAEAIKGAEAMDSLVLEQDPDYPGCSDFITRAGDCYCIEPEGFQLSAHVPE